MSLGLLVVGCLFGQANASDSHRGLHPKERYFTPAQLRSALSGQPVIQSEPGSSSGNTPKVPQGALNALADFAKNNPELAKSLFESAAKLARDNPGLAGGNQDDIAKKLGEEFLKRDDLKELAKKLAQSDDASALLKQLEQIRAGLKKKESEKSTEEVGKEISEDWSKWFPHQDRRAQSKPDAKNQRGKNRKQGEGEQAKRPGEQTDGQDLEPETRPPQDRNGQRVIPPDFDASKDRDQSAKGSQRRKPLPFDPSKIPQDFPELAKKGSELDRELEALRKKLAESRPDNDRQSRANKLRPEDFTEDPRRPQRDRTGGQSSIGNIDQELASAVAEWVRENPELARSMVEAARSAASENTSRDANASDLAQSMLNSLEQSSGKKDQVADSPTPRFLPNSQPRSNPSRSTDNESAASQAMKAMRELAGGQLPQESIKKAFESIANTGRQPRSNRTAPTRVDNGEPPKSGGFIGAIGNAAQRMGSWAAKASKAAGDRLVPKDASMRVDPPSFEQIRAATLPVPETMSKVGMVLAFLVMVAIGVALLWRFKPGILGEKLTGKLRLPPLNLSQMSPREQTAALFERAALERLGEAARPRHHLELAGKIQSQTEHAQKLAALYEQARYSEPNAPFEPANVEAMRQLVHTR